MRMRLLAVLGVVLIVAGGFALNSYLGKGKQVAGNATDVKVAVLYQSNRMGELEPCTCSSKPFGGLDREANAVEAIRKEYSVVLYADAGNMLAPLAADKRLAHFRHKAEVVAGLLNGMKLDVFSPGKTDLSLGLEFLKGIQKKTDFQWVSSNLKGKDGKLIYAPFVVLQRGGVKFAVLGITPVKGAESVGLKADKPEDALAQWVPKARESADVVVLLSQLNIDENEVLVEAFPDIRLVIGGDPAYQGDFPIWVKGNALIVDPHVNGWVLGTLELNLKFPFKGFYSAEAIRRNLVQLSNWEQILEADPKSKPAKKIVKRFKEKSNLSVVSGGSTYAHELLALDKKTYGQENEVTKAIKAYKESVKQRALGE